MNPHVVLIIDDETDICFLLGKVLSEKKYVVSIAGNLAEGFIKLKEVDPSILFLDIRLPDGSGLDALIEIRKKNPLLKIIMMSAYDGEKERKTAFERGADLFISKPLNMELINLNLQNIQSKFEKK